MIHPEIRHKVPDQKVCPSVRATDHEKDTADNGQAKIREQDEMLVLLLVQRAAREEVIDTAIAVLLADTLALWLLLVAVVSSHVPEQIHGPAEQLLGNEHGCSVDWGLLHQLVHLMQEGSGTSGVLFASAWDEDHITLHVAGGLVVLAMADLPAEVWNEKSRVADPPHSVVEGLAGREGLVATLVSKDPEASTEKTLHDSVGSPEHHSRWVRRNVFGCAEGVEEVEGGCQRNDIACNIVKASCGGAFEAVLRNGVAELLDGEVGQLELVAVCVDQPPLRLLLELVDRSKAGKRC